MKNIKVFNLLMIVFVMGFTHKALSSEINISYTKGSDSLSQLVEAASSLYPDEMKQYFSHEVRIKLAKLNQEQFDNDICNSDYKFINVSNLGVRKTISIDPELKNLFDYSRVITCGHGNSREFAIGLVVRAFARILDKDVKISKDRRFLNLSGWISKGLLIKKRRNLNTDFDRLFDDEEVKSKSLTMAVNTELYLMDKNYGCKRLNLNQYFNQFFGLTLNQEKECPTVYNIVLNQKNILKTTNLLQEIDINRIYQIHYLFAGKGSQKMSKWGHSMFRLVICAPGKELGPACLQDVKEHVVISFRANIDELEMNYIKGITGKYKSQMFLMNLMEVIDEYTVGEFRDVTSLPINLTREQIKYFTHSALELFWSYKGKYFFFTNNCATEAMNLLRSAYPDNKMMQSKNILTPLSLYNFLIKKELVDTAVLADREQAIYKGYLFEGITKQLRDSLSYFVELKKDVVQNLEELELLSGEDRFNVYLKGINQFDDKEQSQKRRMAIASALRIENKIYQAINNKFNSKVIGLVTGDRSKSKIDKETLEKIENELNSLFFRDAVDGNLESGYGLAMPDEIDAGAITDFTKETKEQKDTQLQLEQFLLSYFPEDIKKLTSSKENKMLILAELNKLVFKKNKLKFK